MFSQKSLITYLVATTAGCLLSAGHALAAEDFSSGRLSSWDQLSMPIVYHVNAEDAATWPEGVGAVIRSFMSWERVPGARVKLHFAGTTEKKKRGRRREGMN